MPIINKALLSTATSEQGRVAQRRNPPFIGAGAGGKYGFMSAIGDSALRYYNSWTWVCIDKIAEAIAALESRTTIIVGAERREVEPTHWLPTLIDNPNPEIEPVALWSLAARWFAINGNAYLYTPTYDEPTPQEIWVLPSNRVQVIPGGAGEPIVKGYVYYHESGTYAMDASEIIHWKMLDPSFQTQSSLYVGRSPINASRTAITVDKANQEYLARYYENDALPAFVILQPDGMADWDFEIFKSRWNETFMGASGAGKWGLLDGGKTIQPLSSTGRVEEMTRLDDANMKRVCAPWGIPSLKLTGEYNARATAETVEATFQKEAIQPRAKRLSQALTRHARRWAELSDLQEDMTISFEFLPYQYEDPADARAEKQVVGAAVQGMQIAMSAGQITRAEAIASATLIYGIERTEAERLFEERAPGPIA